MVSGAHNLGPLFSKFLKRGRTERYVFPLVKSCVRCNQVGGECFPNSHVSLQCDYESYHHKAYVLGARHHDRRIL